MEFKKGDKVIGNKNASKFYLVTSEGWIGVVVAHEPGTNRLLLTDVGKGSRTRYDVYAHCFDLLEPGMISIW